jgi:endo-1,4-beta-mannosidase
VPLPRIGVREGRFIDVATGDTFEPRGFHYVRLKADGNHYVLQPGLYDAARIDRMLADVSEHGFNTVRIFFNTGEMHPVEGRLPRDWMDNLADFLRRARSHGVHVVLVPDFFPHPSDAAFAIPNALFVDDQALAAKGRYLGDLLGEVRARDPNLLSTILSIELENEACFFMSQAPLSQHTTYELRGSRYDLSNDAGVQALVDAATKAWADALSDAVHRADPDALVGASVFTYAAVGRKGPGQLKSEQGDQRIPLRPLVLASTRVSYVDVHLYGLGPDALERDLSSIEWDRFSRAAREAKKPILMGEYGAFRPAHKSASDAAAAVVAHQRRVLGLGVAGALYWTYDCDEQRELFNAKGDGGVIFDALVRASKDLGGREKPNE